MGRSNRVCCVVGCFNSESKNPELEFYRFPGKSYEAHRRLKWINAVKRLDPDTRKTWEPTDSSRICSEHFEGGHRSENPLKTSYNPTIFPGIYKRITPCDTLKRTDRLTKRNRKKDELEDIKSNKKAKCPDDSHNDSVESYNIEDFQENSVVSVKVDMCIQTDPIDVEPSGDISLLFCSQSGNNISTQTSIVIKNNSSSRKIIVDETEIAASMPKSFKNTSSGPDSSMHVNFTGYSSVHCDKAMKSLGGVSLAYFNSILTFIKPGIDGQPRYFKQLCKEDRLLLFFMKMKLGISFSSLGYIFQVSRVTVSAIFFSILKTLSINAAREKWLFWPSREAIKETAPESFKAYPNCRVIIDCTEIYCDTPPTVEQRILMYSHYKHSYTFKFLIGISPSGLITFVSKSYGGRSTDGFIVNDSGFLNLLEAGDEVMADKGFPTIKNDMLRKNCILVMPPFAWNPQFTKDEVLEGYHISSLRIHVERAIQRIKIFKILQHVTVELFRYISEIMFIACVIANDKEPLISDEKQV